MCSLFLSFSFGTNVKVHERKKGKNMIENFSDFNLSKEVLKAIVEMGFEEPSPIQKQAIPTMLNDEDIIGQAQTGTGKTASFGIPIVEKVDRNNKTTQAMVLCPTRELSIQVIYFCV